LTNFLLLAIASPPPPFASHPVRGSETAPIS
jgi:hypothetical protein